MLGLLIVACPTRESYRSEIERDSRDRRENTGYAMGETYDVQPAIDEDYFWAAQIEKRGDIIVALAIYEHLRTDAIVLSSF